MSSRIVYEPPWICYIHNYFTKKKEEFMQHLHDVPHEATGSNAKCEKCGKKINNFSVPYSGINEPVIILCNICSKIPNVYEFIRAKRRAVYPPSKSVKL